MDKWMIVFPMAIFALFHAMGMIFLYCSGKERNLWKLLIWEFNKGKYE